MPTTEEDGKAGVEVLVMVMIAMGEMVSIIISLLRFRGRLSLHIKTGGVMNKMATIDGVAIGGMIGDETTEGFTIETRNVTRDSFPQKEVVIMIKIENMIVRKLIS